MSSQTYKFYSSKNNSEENNNGEAPSSSTPADILPSRRSDFFNKTVLKHAKKTVSLNTSRLHSKHIASAKKKAVNTSIMRQTLRSNNKALARALEMAKNEIKLLKEENLLLKSANQELQTQLIRHQDIDSFEKLFENAVEECVKTKLAEIMGDIEILVDETNQTMIKQTNCLSEIMKLCKKHSDRDESYVEDKRASSRESSIDDFVKRYSSRQPTIFGRRQSVANDKQDVQAESVEKQSILPSAPARKSSRKSELFIKPSEPIHKPFDLSTVLEQSTAVDMTIDDTTPFLPLEPVCESPEDRRTSSRRTSHVARSKDRSVSKKSLVVRRSTLGNKQICIEPDAPTYARKSSRRSDLFKAKPKSVDKPFELEQLSFFDFVTPVDDTTSLLPSERVCESPDERLTSTRRTSNVVRSKERSVSKKSLGVRRSALGNKQTNVEPEVPVFIRKSSRRSEMFQTPFKAVETPCDLTADIGQSTFIDISTPTEDTSSCLPSKIACKLSEEGKSLGDRRLSKRAVNRVCYKEPSVTKKLRRGDQTGFKKRK